MSYERVTPKSVEINESEVRIVLPKVFVDAMVESFLRYIGGSDNDNELYAFTEEVIKALNPVEFSKVVQDAVEDRFYNDESECSFTARALFDAKYSSIVKGCDETGDDDDGGTTSSDSDGWTTK